MKKIDEHESKGRIDMPKATAAYPFLREACRLERIITLEELVSVSRYSMVTVKKYCKGRWENILVQVDEDHFICHGMEYITLEQFKDNLRQHKSDLPTRKLVWQARLINAITRHVQF